MYSQTEKRDRGFWHIVIYNIRNEQKDLHFNTKLIYSIVCIKCPSQCDGNTTGKLSKSRNGESQRVLNIEKEEKRDQG